MRRSFFCRGIPSCAAVAMLVAGAFQPDRAAADCVRTELDNPPRQSFACTSDFAMEREPSASLKIIERAGEAPPRAIELQNGAILIDVVPGSRSTQIRTPEAIAAVRGTVYIVDSRDGETSVFVLEGQVTVTRPGDSSVIAQVNAGEGADVTPETGISVSRWPERRAAALLARFGR